MANSLRITVDELKNRMEGGEDFTMVDVRKPDVWTESDTMIPESICVPLDKPNGTRVGPAYTSQYDGIPGHEFGFLIESESAPRQRQ